MKFNPEVYESNLDTKDLICTFINLCCTCLVSFQYSSRMILIKSSYFFQQLVLVSVLRDVDVQLKLFSSKLIAKVYMKYVQFKANIKHLLIRWSLNLWYVIGWRVVIMKHASADSVKIVTSHDKFDVNPIRGGSEIEMESNLFKLYLH